MFYMKLLMLVGMVFPMVMVVLYMIRVNFIRMVLPIFIDH
jgi:hypothetical protein